MNLKHITITDEGQEESPVEIDDKMKEDISNSLKSSIPTK